MVDSEQTRSGSKTAIGRFSVRFVQIFAAVSVTAFGVLAGLIQLGPHFKLKFTLLESLGYWGYYLLIFHCVALGAILGFYRFLKETKKYVAQLEATLRSDHGDSGTELSTALVEIVRKFHQTGEHAEVVRFSMVLSRPLWLSGRYKERIAIGTFFEDSAGRMGKVREQAIALIDDIGWTNAVVGNIENAKRHIARGAQIATDGSDYYLAAKAFRHLAAIAQRYGKNFEEATAHFVQSEHMASSIADPRQRKEMLAGIAYDIGEGHLQRLDYGQAESQALRSLAIYSELEDDARSIKVRTLLARIHMMAGDLSRAKDEFRSSLSDAKRVARKDEIGKSLLGLGETYLREGSHGLAKATLAEAIEIFDILNLSKERARSQELHGVALRSEVFIP